METPMTIQGRQLTRNGIDLIRELIREHPDWHRTRLSQELCKLWNWRNANGDLKDMACRTMLLKLDRQALISLPPARNKPPQLGSLRIPDILHSTDPVTASLASLFPITVMDARDDKGNLELFNYFLHHYHYLSFRSIVGENMKYIAFGGQDRPLACLLFGAPAWKTRPRDRFVGWSTTERQKNLNLITNNTRFLILPWVTVKNLASYLLARTIKRINNDWLRRYNHPIHLIETFVDRDRFSGTCYKAANWLCVGKTTGRTRQDRQHRIQAPQKDVYVYPLNKNYRQQLTSNSSEYRKPEVNPANVTGNH